MLFVDCLVTWADAINDHFSICTGDGALYRDALINCSVVPPLLALVSPVTPVNNLHFLDLAALNHLGTG